MNYPDELCRLVIQNMEIVEEAPRVVEAVEKKLFRTINDTIRSRLSQQENWEGTFDLVTESKSGETVFYPIGWYSTEKESCYACYEMTCSELDDGNFWLSHALGFNNLALWISFSIKESLLNINRAQARKLVSEFYMRSNILSSYGFFVAKSGAIYLPFHFSADVVATEYATLEDAMGPVRKAMDTVLNAHNEFCVFVNTAMANAGC